MKEPFFYTPIYLQEFKIVVGNFVSMENNQPIGIFDSGIGGTSIWMTCFALGMILSVSSSKQETEETILDDNPLDILHEAID